ncbi:MAG: DUF1450 domain-containing protein [Phycisphaeraceae bacterium]|nr:DUF1450 domain-containing protein [Phycisphaeraceae bacterium]MCW5761895.1 DUF1450 domain-containing protein [Phycisphaeraceae bacterium]
MDWFYTLAASRPDLDIRACGCLSCCSTCVDTPFLHIDGVEVEGDSHQQIIADKTPEPPTS